MLLISGDVSAKRTVDAYEAGVSGLVAKPFVNEELCEKVLRIIASIAPVTEFSYPTAQPAALRE